MDQIFLLAVGGLVAGLYAWLRDRGDMVGWLLGVAHAALGLIATAAWSAAIDPGFAVSMALLAVYGGAMSAAELIRRIRQSQPAAWAGEAMGEARADR